MKIRKISLAMFIAVIAISCMSITAFAQTSYPSGWAKDRTDPKLFEPSSYNDKSVYKLTINKDATTENFYRFQGASKAITGVEKGNWSVSTSLYVPLELGNNEVEVTPFDTGIWLSINNSPDNTSTIGYPLVGYRNIPNLEELGWYNFDDENGGWHKIDGLDNIVTGWNDLLISCKDNTIEFYINGVFVKNREYTKEDGTPEDVYLTAIILNSCNFGTEYTSYYATPIVGKYKQPETDIESDNNNTQSEADIAKEVAKEEATAQVTEAVNNIAQVAIEMQTLSESAATVTGLESISGIPTAKPGTDSAKQIEAICKEAGLQVAKVEINGEVCVAPSIKIDVAKMGGNLSATLNDMLADAGLFIEIKASDGKTYMIPTSALTKSPKNRVYYPESFLISLAVK